MKIEKVLQDSLQGASDVARRSCMKAKELERGGDYEGARVEMAGLWYRVGERPVLTGLTESVAGEVLQRAGALTGYIGSKQQLARAPKSSLKLISESIGISTASLNVTGRRGPRQHRRVLLEGGFFDEARVLSASAQKLHRRGCHREGDYLYRLAG